MMKNTTFLVCLLTSGLVAACVSSFSTAGGAPFSSFGRNDQRDYDQKHLKLSGNVGAKGRYDSPTLTVTDSIEEGELQAFQLPTSSYASEFAPNKFGPATPKVTQIDPTKKSNKPQVDSIGEGESQTFRPPTSTAFTPNKCGPTTPIVTQIDPTKKSNKPPVDSIGKGELQACQRPKSTVFTPNKCGPTTPIVTQIDPTKKSKPSESYAPHDKSLADAAIFTPNVCGPSQPPVTQRDPTPKSRPLDIHATDNKPNFIQFLGASAISMVFSFINILAKKNQTPVSQIPPNTKKAFISMVFPFVNMLGKNDQRPVSQIPPGTKKKSLTSLGVSRFFAALAPNKLQGIIDAPLLNLLIDTPFQVSVLGDMRM